MELGDTTIIASFGVMIALVEVIKVLVTKFRNGNGKFHPYEESRIYKKLSTLCDLSEKSNNYLSKLVAHCDVEDERHLNLKETLGRIERNTENT